MDDNTEQQGRLEMQIDELKLAIEAAFEEGFDSGYACAQFIDSPSHAESWEQSQAKKDAEGT
jgi:hypothetical protein